jgi:hypothetical protein
MRKRYKIGDFFIIPLDSGKQHGYGRIIGMHKGLKVPAIEYYKVNPRQKYTIDELLKVDYLKRILSFDKVFKSGEWEIIGNIPIESTELIYWQYHMDFEKYLIVNDDGNFVNSIPKEEIKKDWVEFGVCFEGFLIQQYTDILTEYGLFSPIL